MTTYSRRRLLGGIGLAATTAVAGCNTSSPPDESTDDTANDSETSGSEPTDSESSGNESSDNANTGLNLQEANVVDVSVTEQSDSYEFAVSLHHDDDGESGYADWWQVEQLDGTALGRRDLAHPHSNQPFTRSTTVEVPDDVDCVVVRGHDQTHGYGGQVMLVTVESGATEAVDQGPEPDSFEGIDCP